MKAGPTPQVQKDLTLAAKMRASGFTFEEIAKHFGKSPESIRTWLKRHRSLWQAAYSAVMSKAVEEVAELAGSSAVLEIPTSFMAAAEAADRWSKETNGEPLFPDPTPEEVVGADLTVPAFVEHYMLPRCLPDAAPETRRLYRRVAKKFALVMGNPPLRTITVETLTTYRDALKGMIGRGKKKPLSINTVRTYLSHLQHILDRAGPPSQRRRDAAGYLKSVPWIRLPMMQLKEPRIVTEDELARCYAAADKMVYPKLKGVSAAAWWRALLITGRYLGLRARTVFALEFTHLDTKKRQLLLPATIMKSRKALCLPLPDVVFEHLTAKGFHTNRRYVFDYDTSQEQYRVDFRRLQKFASILPQNYFGLHALRKTAITRLYEKSPQAASLLAGHANGIITKLHYVATGEAIAGALRESAAQPFTALVELE